MRLMILINAPRTLKPRSRGQEALTKWENNNEELEKTGVMIAI